MGTSERSADRSGSCDLRGSVALVTGGGRGLGRVLAQGLAAAGAAVGLVARSADQLAETAELIRTAGGVAATATADVTDSEQIAAALQTLHQELGPVDLLVNNAGVNMAFGAAWEVDPALWWREIEINLNGVFLCSRLVLPDMVARESGRIVNVTSEAGAFRWPRVSAYSVGKAAVIKLTENLAYETRRSHVSVFSMHPGILPIGFGERGNERPLAPPGSTERYLQDWARKARDEGRLADPQWAVNLLLRLASGEADALTGRHISVHDDLDALLADAHRIRSDDLYVLRVRDR